jgi:hypothetical protein
MFGGRNRSLCVAVAAAVFFVLLRSGRALADAGVSIQYESEDQLELARRVASELASEGYAADISPSAEPSPCDVNGPKLVTVPRGTKAWIRLAADPSDADTIIAFICYLGAQPFLQQAAPSAPRAEAQELALATAEALNGLRSKLPPLESDPERVSRPPEIPPPPREEPPRPAPPPLELVNSAVLAAAFVWNLPDFPLASGVTGRATLGVVPSVGIAIDAFVPIEGRELASETVTATVRTSWLRVGPRFRGALGDFDLSVAALAGPALTWATAVASLPRIGTTDVATGAIVTLSSFVEYPRRAAVFTCASVSASALLPGVEVNLGDDAPAPRGAWPIEASIGFGARWGAGP